MKHFYSSIILTLSLTLQSTLFCKAQTYPSSVYLTSQSQVDAFGADGFTQVDGDLFIGQGDNVPPSNITDLTPLSGITTINGDLILRSNGVLTNVNGLQNINYIEGNIQILNNTALQSISHFSEINDSSDRISIVIVQLNPALTSLEGLEDITFFNIMLEDNQALTSLYGVHNSDTLGTVSIENCNQLTSLASFDNISYLAGVILIENDGLTSLDGVESVDDLSSIIRVKDNPNLTDFCALNNIDTTTLSIYDVQQNAYNPTLQDLLDGNCSPNVSIEEHTSNAQIHLTPNPTHGVFNINFESVDTRAIHIINQLGQIVYQQNNITSPNHEIQLDVPHGVYTVRIHSSNSEEQLKFIKL